MSVYQGLTVLVYYKFNVKTIMFYRTAEDDTNIFIRPSYNSLKCGSSSLWVNLTDRKLSVLIIF